MGPAGGELVADPRTVSLVVHTFWNWIRCPECDVMQEPACGRMVCVCVGVCMEVMRFANWSSEFEAIAPDNFT